MKTADEVVGAEGAKHVADVLANHCPICRKVLELWIKNQEEWEQMKKKEAK